MTTRPARAAAVRPPLIGLGRVFVGPESPSPRETRPRRESKEESPGRPLCGFHLLPRNITRPARPAAVRPPLIGAEQVSVIHSSPFLRETHPRRESNEESPESRRLFGAGLGRAAPTDSPQKTLQSQCGHAKTHSISPPTPFSAFPRLFVPCRDRHQKTRTPEVNQKSPITAPTIRERATGDHDPRRNRNGTYRKPSCLALMRQTAGVIEHKTFRQERMMGANEHKTSQ